MKRVLHLITGLEFGGGAENMILKIVPNLKKTKNAVCCIKGKGEIGKELEKNGIKVFYLEMKNVLDFSIIFKYMKVLKTFKPDVQVNYLIHADFFGRIFGKLFGLKKVVSYNRLRYKEPTHKFLDFITFPLVDYLITNSEVNLRYYRRIHKRITERSTCISNGVELEKFNFKLNIKKKLKELNLREEEFKIVCVGRLNKQKDHPTLFKAIKLLKNPKIKLILCGDGEERKNLIKFRDKLKLQRQINFLGKRKDVLEILRVADLFVLPSLYEGMSNAILEAMASKCAIIVSDIPENKELIEDKKNGLTFNAGNYCDLAEKIKIMQQNKNLRIRMGEEAYKTIKRKYLFSDIIKKYDEFLLKI